MLRESIYSRLFQDGTSEQRGEWVKICDLKSSCNALPQMWYESLLAACWTISISPRRDQDGAGLIRPSHRLDDETGERILLRWGRVKVRHFYLFFYDHVLLCGPLDLSYLLQTWCVLWAWHPQPSASALHSRLDKWPVLPVEYIYRRRKVEDMCPHTAARQS